MRISDWSSDVCSSDLEHHAVEERARIAVVQRKLPVLAAIFGSIDARGLARADGEHYCCACIEAFDVAEVELVRARHHDVPPVSSALARAQHGALGAAGPGDGRSEEHTSELQPTIRTSYARFCSHKKRTTS